MKCLLVHMIMVYRSRVKFMLEVVLAIKNNNIRKIPNYDTSHMDHLKKLLRGFVKGISGYLVYRLHLLKQQSLALILLFCNSKDN